jgi:eukaryotic-like serine/threonine-protein kinase
MPASAVDALFLSFQSALAGRYSLERELGRGGMGVVYLAREVRLDRPVAIKLLPPELAAIGALRDRFLREARTAARLSHPYIVPIHSVDEIDGFVFYVMAYVDGETLAQRVAQRGPLPPAEMTRVLREVAWALAYAHAQGVVHRDIKPANILLERGTERAMVTDFGIARLAHASGETGVGELLGTPEYMSPEQASGEPVDGRSDLYSLGVVGFFGLTGQLPFSALTTQGVLVQHLTKAAPPVSTVARGVPAALARTIDRCLEKAPGDRYPTGESLAEALAPATDARNDVPVPIRVFVDRRRMMMMVMPPAMAIPMLMGLTARAIEHGSTLRFLGIGGTLAAAVALPLGILLYRLRTVLRLGYGPDDIAAGLQVRFERLREEFQYEFGSKPSVREKTIRAVGVVGIVTFAFSATGLLMHVSPQLLAPVAALGAYAGVIGTILSGKWRRLRRASGPRGAEWWQSRVGRALARIAGFKLGQRAVPANRPTELAIAMSAEALYDAFPKDIRESLGDVPAVLRALQAHAHEARARIEELDATLAETQRGPARASDDDRRAAVASELRDARARAEARLADVVMALENVRLDLLRLHAGTVTAAGITQDLAAARALGESADRAIAGLKEAEALLKP